MCAVMNGLALHGGFIPYGGTFLVFSDYARNALRLAALMRRASDLRLHARFHRAGRGRADAPAGRARSPACGSFRTWTCGGRATRSRPRSPGSLPSSARDGPTAPAPDPPERAVPWRATPQQLGERAPRRLRARRKRRGTPRAVIIATGSEVALAVGAQERLAGEGAAGARGVDALHQRVRPPGCGLPRRGAAARRAARRGGGRRAGFLAQVRRAWRAPSSACDRFGESAPASELFKHFGFTPDKCRRGGEGDIVGCRFSSGSY